MGKNNGKNEDTAIALIGQHYAKKVKDTYWVNFRHQLYQLFFEYFGVIPSIYSQNGFSFI